MLTIDVPELSFVEVPLEPEKRVVRRGRAPRGESPPKIPDAVSIGVPQVRRLLPENVAEDAELKSFVEQNPEWHFSLIHLACSFRPPDDQPFRKAWFSASLYIVNARKDEPPPIAWSLEPRLVADSVQVQRKTTLGTSLKFLDIGGSAGSERTETKSLSTPFLQAFGELESEPYWEFNRTEQTPIQGSYRLSMIVKSPARFAARADFSLSTEIETKKFGFVTYRAPAGGAEALKVKLS